VASGGECNIYYIYNGILTFLFPACFLTPLIFALRKLMILVHLKKKFGYKAKQM